MHQKFIEIDEHLSTSRNISHYLLPTKHRDRYDVLKRLIDVIDPYICIIFCNKREEVEKLSHQLREDGYKVGEIHGNLEPRERRQMMRRIQNMEYQYIVATDIAARGIDIDGVSHIINMEFPTELDFIFIVVVVVVEENIQVNVIICMIHLINLLLKNWKRKGFILKLRN